ncbi:MAG: hypothetical protein J0L96_22385 [Anaerolineae bacterium]|nr:hypothetical protein [Anaerolineae bacterium]
MNITDHYNPEALRKIQTFKDGNYAYQKTKPNRAISGFYDVLLSPS